MLEGLVGLLMTVLAGALLLGLAAPAPRLRPVGGRAHPLPHAGHRRRSASRAARPPPALGHRAARPRAARASWPRAPRPTPGATPRTICSALIVVDLALIVAGSAGMVQTALTLGDDWHISSAVLGALILGPLTSIPNAATAVRLGRAGRGAALVGETFNSNTINLAAGVVDPVAVRHPGRGRHARKAPARLAARGDPVHAGRARPARGHATRRRRGAHRPVFRLRGGYARGLMNEQQIRARRLARERERRRRSRRARLIALGALLLVAPGRHRDRARRHERRAARPERARRPPPR